MKGEAYMLRDCFVRAAPGRRGRALGVARRGECLPRTGDDRGGWRGVAYGGGNGWVAERFVGELGTRADRASGRPFHEEG